MFVRDVMTAQVNFVASDAPVNEIARLMRDEGIGSVPVADGEKLVGMITDRDIVVRGMAEGQDPRALRARDVMSPQILFCLEDQTLEEVLEHMGQEQVRRMPVVDANRRLVGVVSLGDLSRAAQKPAGSALKEISEPEHAH
jgi:CBS domain-containing protein